MKAIVTFELLFLSVLLAGAANPLPASRTPGGRGSWSGVAGVPGGVPNRTTIYTTLAAGASLSTAQSAINSCPSNQVVQLSAGSYNWSSGTLYIYNNGVTLRGAGTSTVISGTIEIGHWQYWNNMHSSPASGNHVNVTSGFEQGSSNLTVASTSGYSVGQLIILDQLNDNNTTLSGNEGVTGYAYCSVAYPTDGRDRAQHQVSRIAAINGNVITLSDPVYMPNYTAALDPEVWRFPDQPTVMSGVENLRLNGLFRIHNSYSCWISNCVVANNWSAYGGDNGFLRLLWSGRCAIQRCIVTTSDDAVSTEDYGIEPRVCSGLLVENNIVNNIGLAIQISGCSGSVFAYNYLTNVVSGGNWMSAGFLNHGGFPYMNLCEGNVMPSFGLNNTDSPSGYNVCLRNWCQGIDQRRAVFGNIQAVEINGTNRNCSVIGSVLGTPGVSYASYIDGPNCSGGKRIYSLGFWAPECSTPYDLVTSNTLVKAYNWDAYHNGIVADGYTAGDIPASYYLSSRPSWFGNLTWPPIDPANTTYSMSRTNIPACYRFVYGAEPPAASTNQLTPPTGLRVISP
jgi:hypothetical protein